MPNDMINFSNKKRSSKKDRSNGKYSEEAFLALPRDKQFSLAQKYCFVQVKEFDDGTFQFSRDHFIDLCSGLGFKKAIIDTKTAEKKANTIYLERGRRTETVERKFTLNKETDVLIDEYLSSGAGKLSNMEKSKIIDAVINKAFSELLNAQKNGQTTVAYRQVGEERLL